MVDKLFKTLFLLVAICATVILFLFYQKGDGRFQMVAFANSPAKVLDTKTGQVYTYTADGYYMYKANREKVYFKTLPK